MSHLLVCLAGLGIHAGAILVTNPSDNDAGTAPCKNWCTDARHRATDWHIKCVWRECSGCTACLQLHVSPRTDVDFKSLLGMSNDDKVRFSHIPKAGGTFVEGLLRDLNFTNYKFAHTNRFNEIGDCTNAHLPPGEGIDEGDSSRSNIAASFFTEAGVESFAVIRHPYERAASQWGWRKGLWNRHLGYPLTAEGMNFYLQDALKNASKKRKLVMQSPELDGKITVMALHGAHLHDCHFVPQIDYVFNKNRSARAIRTLLNFSTMEQDLFSLLARHSHQRPASEVGMMRIKSLRIASLKYERDGEDWISKLSDKTMDAIDKFYAEDFDLMGFSKYRNK